MMVPLKVSRSTIAAQSGVGEGVGPAGERLIRRESRRRLFLHSR